MRFLKPLQNKTTVRRRMISETGQNYDYSAFTFVISISSEELETETHV